jgi:hypothetical protein
MKYPFSITAWYLQGDRLLQLLDAKKLASYAPYLSSPGGIAACDSTLGLGRALLKQELEVWLKNNSVPSLGELLSKYSDNPIPCGTKFTIIHDFYCKGLTKFQDCANIPLNAMAEIHTKTRYDGKVHLRIPYSPRNLIGASSWARLSGHARLFCFAYVESHVGEELIARPYAIGDFHGETDYESGKLWQDLNYGEIHPSFVDQFKKITNDNLQPSRDHLNFLKTIKEEDIKSSIADIVGEPYVNKDWGGEKSDLFTSRLTVDAKPYSTAFLFKGRSKFSPMTLAHLGKNGDQIDRLFTEPASLLVVQHCHEVTTSVRNTLKAYASRAYDLRNWMVIDGFDTYRILKAYKKCGL